ncbi:unnamed protein product [Ambrosiozyma monospora]|uniref:Unnamed protein product n=1 Tax=Ambrosiozyma monospora TaxID=43982 RepID=A0ACB5TTA8_AMBMO|nr:unnamed protein product [Ambrosiozyma monospora]
MYFKFIALPLKATEGIDFMQPGLKNYLLSNYGPINDFQEDFRTLTKARVETFHSGKNDPKVTRELYLKYLNHLESLELRVPPNLIQFQWSESRDTEELVTQESISFEKANLLFNLAAVNSKMAVDLGDSNLKTSIECFGNAAGIFQFLQDNFINAPLDDLKIDSISAMKNLMKAEAQEAFLVNYLYSNTIKETLVAKLAMSAAHYYSHTLSSLGKLEEETCLDRKLDLITLKTKYYYSLGNYYQGLHHKSSNEFGLAIIFA